MDMEKIQKDIWQNKLNKGFNTTDANKEFCLLYREVAEAYDAWNKMIWMKNQQILLFT